METNKTLLFTLIYGFVFASLAITIPLYLDSIGYSLSEMGVVLGTAALLSSFIGIGLAALGDRFGRKFLLSLYPAASALGTGLIASFASLPAIILGNSLWDFAKNNTWNTVLARISDLSRKENRGFAVGLFSAAFALTYALSHFIAGSMISSLGFFTTFSIIIAASLSMSALALLFKETANSNHRLSLSLGILKTRNGFLNFLLSFFTGLSDIVYIYVIYIFFKYHFGLDAEQTGFFLALAFLLWPVASYFSGPLVDRYGIKRSMAFGALVNGLLWVAALFFQEFWPFMLIITLDAIFWPLYSVGGQKLSSIIPKKENIGRDVSIFGVAYVLGIIAASFAGGFLAEISFSLVFAVRAAVMLLAGLIVFFLMKIRD